MIKTAKLFFCENNRKNIFKVFNEDIKMTSITEFYPSDR